MGLFKTLKGHAISQIKKQIQDPGNQAKVLGAATSVAKKGVSALQGKIAKMRRGGKVRRVRVRRSRRR
jgi:hypothetical protein